MAAITMNAEMDIGLGHRGNKAFPRGGTNGHGLVSHYNQSFIMEDEEVQMEIQNGILEPNEVGNLRLKKNTLSQSLREFFKPTRHAVFYFLFFIFYFFYFNWPLLPRTSETKNDRKVSTSVFSEIKRDFTRFLSSHVLKFFQNSKLSSFFVVKREKKKFQEKKK